MILVSKKMNSFYYDIEFRTLKVILYFTCVFVVKINVWCIRVKFCQDWKKIKIQYTTIEAIKKK